MDRNVEQNRGKSKPQASGDEKPAYRLRGSEQVVQKWSGPPLYRTTAQAIGFDKLRNQRIPHR